MRHITAAFLGAAALTLGAMQIVNAADLPRRAPAAATTSVMAPVPVFNWSGFYVGLHGGYGWGDFTAFGDSIDMDGWFGGGQLGVNWQAPGSPWVWGVEVDSAFSDLNGSVSGTAGTFTASASSEINYFGTARLRAGYAWDRWMAYVTGGAAWAHNEITATAGIPGLTASASDNQTHVGWTIGGGFEWAFAPQWSAKLEYLFLDLGKETYFESAGGGFDADVEAHTVKLGLNYRFQ